MCYVFVFVRACTQVRMVFLATSICVYVYVVLEGMYRCNTGNFGNEHLCLYLCWYRGYVDM